VKDPRVVDSPYFEQKIFLVMFYIATVPWSCTDQTNCSQAFSLFNSRAG
jgi:hypothetical protein